MMKQQLWGQVNGIDVFLFTLNNQAGDTVTISNYGGIITGWESADRAGQRSSIVIGFKHLAQYLPNDPHFGALVGRYANRIAQGHFTIDGTQYSLPLNNGRNHIHGGKKNFSVAIWTPTFNQETNTLALGLTSKDGDEGYPGDLNVAVVYSFNDDNGLEIKYTAETNKPTVVNLTNHCYFNLTGSVRNNVMDHVVQINSGRYTPVDGGGIPDGSIVSVKNTPFDFTAPHKIGERILETGNGYDQNYVLNNAPGTPGLCATASEQTSGRILEVFTDQPGLQLYTGNSLDGKWHTDEGDPINRQTAICFETQHFPDSPNHPAFPTTVLRPGETFRSTTLYRLSVRP
jgi:aldose 1-epimerase